MLGKRVKQSENIDDLSNNFSNFNIKSTNKKAIIYSRVSSKSQLDSLMIQTKLLKDYCKENNYEISEILEEVGSAYENFDQLTLNELINRHPNINLIIKEPSRMARDIGEGGNLINTCIQRNVLIHVVDHNYTVNTNSELKKLLCGIVDAHTESQTLSQRLKGHNMIKKSMGHYFGAIPYGMEVSINTINNIKIRKLINLDENHSESKIIKLILMMYNGIPNGDSKEFYTLFNSLHTFPPLGGMLYKFHDINNNNYTKEDFQRGFMVSSIVDLLNDWGVLKRGNMWTKNSLMNVISYHNN
jgi:DNA invertase Pin-like site-specific DNA recombinase